MIPLPIAERSFKLTSRFSVISYNSAVFSSIAANDYYVYSVTKHLPIPIYKTSAEMATKIVAILGTLVPRVGSPTIVHRSKGWWVGETGHFSMLECLCTIFQNARFHANLE
jgi:hypothetical protein